MKKSESKLKCAICGIESMQPNIISFNSVGAKTHLDLRVVGKKFSLADRLQTCPLCHYCHTNISQNVGVTLSDVKSKEYLQIHHSKISDLAKKYVLSAWIFDKANQPRHAGVLYHHASWVFDDEGDIINADKYRKLACDRILKDALKEDDCDTIVQCIDLCRRNGNFQKAIELIRKIGTTEIKQIDNVINYEKILIAIGDKSTHFLEETNAKISMQTLTKLMLLDSNFKNSEITIYAPIIYNLKNEYFDAIVKYLASGEKTILTSNNGYSTETIEHVYWSDRINYVKAVLILNSLELAKENAESIYQPKSSN